MTKSLHSGSTTSELQHAELGITDKRQSLHSRHPDAQWFPRAGLGLFIHWGIASVHGNFDLSWAMMANSPWDAAANGKNKTTPDDYWALADRFNPDAYDPDKWIRAAADAGFQYAVLTTMHHDGYTLWPSQHSDLGVQSHLGGRDLVGPFVEACRRHGLKVGLYYSPPDWYFDRNYRSFNYGTDSLKRYPGRPAFDTRHQPADRPAMPEEHVEKRRRQFHGRVRELLTRWGRIDLMWFDGSPHDDQILSIVRDIQPHIVVNSRVCSGDYDHTECFLPTEKPSGWFETCHCWQQTDIPTPSGGTVDVWGYLSAEQYKSTAWMLEHLAKLRAFGANLLVNVGPKPTGEMPDVVYDRLRETAEWMKHSKISVIGADPAEAVSAEPGLPITQHSNTFYVHVLPDCDGRLSVNLPDKPKTVRLLRLNQPLTFDWNGSTLSLEVPSALRTRLVDVVAITI